MKCPHCGKGSLIERITEDDEFNNWAYPYGYWDCNNCGRGWKGQKDGTLISEDSTDKEMYDPKTKRLTPL
jgi:hypothetical protein